MLSFYRPSSPDVLKRLRELDLRCPADRRLAADVLDLVAEAYDRQIAADRQTAPALRSVQADAREVH